MNTLLEKAIDFAVEKHKGQTRKTWNKIPYIVHPLQVMYNLGRLGIEDENTLCGAVLHDVLEDTSTTYSELSYVFGSYIANVVKELTCMKVENDEQDKLNKANYILTFGEKNKTSTESLVVKLSDRIANVEDAIKAGKKRWAKNLYKKGEVLWEFANNRYIEIYQLYDTKPADRLFEWIDKKQTKFERL